MQKEMLKNGENSAGISLYIMMSYVMPMIHIRLLRHYLTVALRIMQTF